MEIFSILPLPAHEEKTCILMQENNFHVFFYKTLCNSAQQPAWNLHEVYQIQTFWS